MWRVIGVVILAALLAAASVSGERGAAGESETAQTQHDGTLRRVRVPILMYHYVSDLPEDADDIRRGLTITPDQFREQMVYLRAAGYTTISLYQLRDALTRGTPLPSQPIILTFDDGYLDHYLYVFPTLRRFGYTGTFFIITGLADAVHPGHLNWAQIREMAAAGMSMESHTKNHPDLRNRSYEFLVYELLGSLESLQAHTGVSAHMLAYPVGRYDDAVLAVVRQMPIWSAVTTQPGVVHTTDRLLELARVRVPAGAGAAGLAAALREYAP